MKSKAMNFSLSSVLWIVLPLMWEGMNLAMKNFVDTIEKEAPDIWERLGKPKYNAFGGVKGMNREEFRAILKPGAYNALNNPKISRAGLWVHISYRVLFGSVAVVLIYYVFLRKS